ncbi:ABC-three component system protein [Aquimarina sp. W85]|uniref:ABC-three component system protein n=1 Tax=Aquimarina rhodophyticola TaxID=3342246 RepID=UPI0036720A93
MSDSAKGSFSGYLFQFERALLLLSDLESDSDYISIENVDDIATHKTDGTVLITDQSKHSISESGTTFGDTTYALWRTLQLWVEKTENKIFDNNTIFICSTNKPISKNSLLHFICNNDFNMVKEKILELRTEQIEKLSKTRGKNKNKGKSIESILKLINFIIKKFDIFEVIQPSIEIKDNTNLKTDILNRLHLNSKHISELQQNNIYEGMLGWLTSNSLKLWRNAETAEFRKMEMNNKYQSLINRPSIVNALFRVKSSFSINNEEIEAKKDELFVKQIELLSRKEDAKNRIIKKAIEDFIRYEIEHTYIINEQGDFTKEDFSKFIDSCFEEWQSYFDDKVIFESSRYTEDEKNELAIEVYGHIMNRLKINFNNDYKFNTDNIYIKNGSFLKLSNIPKIGWHPDWKERFKDSKHQ